MAAQTRETRQAAIGRVVKSGLRAVITTITEPAEGAVRLAGLLEGTGGRLIVVGDRKGPARFDLPGCRFLSLADQAKLPFRLARALPTDHYARKNIGYLLAVLDGAGCIYETDDDNIPSADWKPRALAVDALKLPLRPWLNAYRFFSDESIWPRGFPLRLANDPDTFRFDDDPPIFHAEAPIQQGLADCSPDVDAVWRLLLNRELHFRGGPSVWLPPGAWCPINSQSTWWWPPAFPLLYLPSHCSFRLTDIWRGLVAQRCLWEMGKGLVFHAAEVVQHRNVHDLMRDFRDEIPGYLANEEIALRLSGLELSPGPGAAGKNLMRCYERLCADGFIPRDELSLADAWLGDLSLALGRPRQPDTSSPPDDRKE